MAQPIEIVFSFDTTSSMNTCLAEVRKQLKEIARRLFQDIPNIRIGILAHGDYCDRHSSYLTLVQDFVEREQAHRLVDFVDGVSPTFGGDWEEYVMMETQRAFSWSVGSQRALVMIGDAHIPSEAFNQIGLLLNWEDEAEKLVNMGVRISAVRCTSALSPAYLERAATFWQDLSTLGHGRYLVLENFATIVDMFMAICYREAGAEFFQAFEKEVHAREGAGIRSELTTMFDALRDDVSEGSSGYGSVLSARSPSPSKVDAVKRNLFPVSAPPPFTVPTPAEHSAPARTPVSAPVSAPARTPVSAPTRTPGSARAARAARRSLLREFTVESRLRPSTINNTRKSVQESRRRTQEAKKPYSRPASTTTTPSKPDSVNDLLDGLRTLRNKSSSSKFSCSVCGGH